jgi:hypothetical protein
VTARPLAGFLGLALVTAGCSPFAPAIEVSNVRVKAEARQVIVSWQTSRPAFSRCELVDKARGGAPVKSPARDLAGTEFRAVMGGLEPDRVYAWGIASAADRAELDGQSPGPLTSVRTLKEIKISGIEIRSREASADVSWRTDIPTDTMVQYGRTEEFESTKMNPRMSSATVHEVSITGLEPMTTYHLRVVARDPAGGAAEQTSPSQTFTTGGKAAGGIERIMPRQGPKGNALSSLSAEYLKKLKGLSAEERKKLEQQLEEQAPSDLVELTAAEKKELAVATDPADKTKFEHRVDLVHRWVLWLTAQGKDVGPLKNAAVNLHNRYFLVPAQATRELDAVVKELTALDVP